MIQFKTKIEFNRAKLNQKAQAAYKAAQLQLDEDVLKDSNYYIPKDTSNLESSGITSSLIGKGKIIWNTVYARRLYYNPQYNFSKDKNPNAQGLWFEAAKAQRGSEWLSKVKDKYRQYFNGR